MSNIPVFKDIDNKWYTVSDITDCLKTVGADKCDILFAHTDVSFGIPNAALKRKQYLDALYESLLFLNVGTLMFPSFTYSFCNNENYDVRNSKTSMGALIEHIRKKDGVKRSLDPLLSMIAIGKQEDIVDGNVGNHSLGKDSVFNRLHNSSNAKFLFFGADFTEYFTYVHYVEKMLNVPYRFDKAFSGKIIDYSGNEYDDTHYIHTQCGGVKLKNYQRMKNELFAEGKLQIAKLGNSEVAVISEVDAYNAIYTRITSNINSFVEPFIEADLTYEYTFGKNGERITHC